MNLNMQSDLFSDEVVMESMNAMRLAQPPKERLHYFDTVMEGTAETNAILLQKLYTDIISRSNIDFGSIPDSRGNLIKYKEYPLIQESMERLNILFEGVASEELTLMNKFHDMIISCKKDYEFGFSFDIEMIKLIYNVAVTTLYDLINICILSYTKKVRKDAGIEFDFGKIKKKDILVLKNAKSLLKSYQTGQWAKMMTSLKKDPRLFEGSDTATISTEASLFGKQSLGEAVKAGVDFVKSLPKAITIPAAIITSIIIIFFAIRGLIYAFFCARIKMSDNLKIQKEFVDAAIRQEKEDGEPDVIVKKHTKLADRIQSLANFFEVKLLHSNSEAEKELEKSNQTNYKTSDFKNPFGGNIEI